MNIPFIDIHTHRPVNSEEIQSVPSLFLQDVDSTHPEYPRFSAAIHPWHASQFTPDKVGEMLENIATAPGIIAIGETGLDKACSTDYQLQKLIFGLHLDFAVNHHKPLIIHAVRSWNDLIISLRHTKIPVIIHGYSGGKELTKQLIDLGFYLSVGESVLRTTPRFRESLQLIPLTSLFLETDESGEDIRKIYHEISQLRGLSPEEFKIQIFKNFKTVFC